MHDPIDLGRYLHERGHRLTTPRRIVWDVLDGIHGHLTAEQVAARVRREDPRVKLASVYRSLALFADVGLARESQLGTDGPARWEVAHPDDEFHLICSTCGSVEHHGGQLVEEIRSHLSDGHGFRADGVELSVTGTCATCLAEQT